MLRIRLRRVGKKGRPCYRIVVADQRAPRDGAFVEQLGHYDPMQDPPAVTLDEERARVWLEKGAQPLNRYNASLSGVESRRRQRGNERAYRVHRQDAIGQA